MSYVRLITQRILDSFAEVVYVNRSSLYRVWLLTPWISGSNERTDAVFSLAETLASTKATLILITRPPADAWHLRSLEVLRKSSNATAYLCKNLHVKLYIAECDDFEVALLGSANLTARANSVNKELALELRSTGSNKNQSVSQVIAELKRYASELRGDDDVQLM